MDLSCICNIAFLAAKVLQQFSVKHFIPLPFPLIFVHTILRLVLALLLGSLAKHLLFSSNFILPSSGVCLLLMGF